MKILVINCGSSSFKYQLLDMTARSVMCSGLVERIGAAMGSLVHKKAPDAPGERKFTEERPFVDHRAGMTRVMELLTAPEEGVITTLAEIDACGHRVVQGGEKFTRSTRINTNVLNVIKDLSPLAPLHNPPSIQGIEVIMQLLPDCPSVAVFDTEFHSTMPPEAFMYALPYDLYEQHRVRRYGFHGTSHNYVARQAANLLGLPFDEFNAITCHLGNGSSITAVQNGKCADTSMGLTPLAGVIMGTRCGDIDPAIHAFLAANTGMSLTAIDNMLNRQSGLTGICGMNDMRDLHSAREKGDFKAQLAFDMFCRSIRKYIGAYYAVLGRVDAIVFTAGIGENDNLARASICEGLSAFGLVLDSGRNETRSGEARVISTPDSAIPVLVVPTNEEIAIAEATMKVLDKGDTDENTKKLRVASKNNLYDCRVSVARCVETVDGLEEAHINLATGEITYGPGLCTSEEKLREAFAREGLVLEKKEE